MTNEANDAFHCERDDLNGSNQDQDQEQDKLFSVELAFVGRGDAGLILIFIILVIFFLILIIIFILLYFPCAAFPMCPLANWSFTERQQDVTLIRSSLNRRSAGSERHPPSWSCEAATPAVSTKGSPRIAMIIVLKPHATPEVVDHVLERITALGFTPHLSQGVARTIIGVIGDEAKLQVEPLQAIPGVEQVVPILKPFKLASREFHPEGSVFEAKGVKIGGGHLAVIAGPCAIESESILFEIAGRVRDAGANILRGGAFKPRTSPYSFQGLGRDGLKILQAAGERFGMPVVTEVMDPRQVEMVDALYRHPSGRCSQHAEFRPAQGVRADAGADLAQAGHECDRQRPVDVRRVRPLRREPAGDSLRARNPDVRGFDAEHARPVDRP